MIPKRFATGLDHCIAGFFLDTCATAVHCSEVMEMQVQAATTIVATLGYTGDAVNGALMVVSRAESLRASHPMTAMGAEVSDADLNDWIGEIANQILGRFKNAMLPYGLNLKMSVPTMIRGAQMQLAASKAENRLMRGVRSDSGLLFGFALLVAFEKGFSAEAIDNAMEAAAVTSKEGEGFLF